MELTSLALFVLFGVNSVIYGCLCLHKPKCESKKAGEKSTPLEMTETSVRSFSSELTKLGVLITFAYMCENMFPKAAKEHDMDTFWSFTLILFIVSVFNARESKSSDILNREQTEEWKGWMQFMFLMYHYFSAHEVYNTIRVFITCYVWMTGFGNFSFFYMKADYGAVRLLQMVWRLNFLVFFLCMAMGNSYILYYICPLHTFYFFFVYVIMVICKKYNYTEHGMKVKLAVAASVIFIVWDLDMNVFDKIFWFLGDTSIEGAPQGKMWEWYFRTSLDHWSTLFGVIFALNYPATALWVQKIETLPVKTMWVVKVSVASMLLLVSALWATTVLPMDKLAYNEYNAYLSAIVPMLTYIYMRNLTPWMRTHYLEPLHSLGKITLETYLMQHHIWLNSNAKTVLVILPGSPRVNMVIVSVIYIAVSKELYRLTMSLRGMCLPENLSACLKNIAGIIVGIGLSILVAKLITVCEVGIFVGGILILTLGLFIVIVIHCAFKSDKGYDGGLVSFKIMVPVSIISIVSTTVYQILLYDPIIESVESLEIEVPVNKKDISGMGNMWMGLIVVILAGIMVNTKDSYHGLVRATVTALGEGLDSSWEGIYGDLLRKIGKYPIDEGIKDVENDSLLT